MRRSSLLAGLLLFLVSQSTSAAEPTVIQVWPDKAPGVVGDEPPEVNLPPKPGQDFALRLSNVSQPTLTIYRPDPAKDTKAAVIVAPGGGYRMLAFDKEGTEVAEWLATLGITGIVLKYRVPRAADLPASEQPIAPLQDAQRAVSLVRSRASELGIDPNKIGFLGFSAGGHLAASVVTNFDKRAYDKLDSVDEISCRPDFGLLIYPGYVALKDSEAMDPRIRVSAETPPCFLVHTHDDGHTSESSIRMYVALKRAGVPAELHVYSKGGHGYGLRKSENAISTWPARAEDWFKATGVIPK